MRGFVHDVMLGLRLLRQSPGFAALTILTFALGLGLNITIFSVVDAVVLRPLAVAEPDRIVKISNEDAAHRDRGDRSSWIEVQHFAQSQAFAGVTASERRAAVVRDADDAHLLLVNIVGDNYFDTFQLKPASGHLFTATEASARSAAPMVVISYGLWQRQFNGDPAITGRTLVASDVSCLVVGVLPRAFRGTDLFVNPDLYLPMSTWLTMNPGDRVRLERPQSRQLDVFARLRPGVTPDQAAAGLVPLQAQLAAAYPEHETGRKLTVRPEHEMRNRLSAMGNLLLGLAALILSIAAVNIANLLLVRGETRRQEILTRVALGASRVQTVRQLVTETLVLAAFGLAAALLFARWAMGLMPTLMPPMDFPVGFDFRLDGRVLIFGGCVTLLLVMLAGVLPAFSSSHVTLESGIRQGTTAAGRRGRWRDAMVIGQVAVTVVLLIASGLLVRTLLNLRQMDAGFDQRGQLLIATLDVRKLNLQREHAYYRAMMEKFSGVPGVESSTAASRIPMWGSGGGAAIMAWIPGLSDVERDGRRVGFAVVAPDYFSTMGTRIVRGRPITGQDDEQAAPVAVLNESAARLLWPNEEAIGRRFRVNGSTGREVEVVGIAQDGRYVDMTEKQRAYAFLPLFGEAQIFGSRWGAEVVIVRTAGPAAAAASVVRETLRTIDPDVRVLSMRTMGEHVDYALYVDRLIVRLVGSMGALGLILGAVGLFGVISYWVARRRREIGVRIAIGANPLDVVRMIFTRAAVLAGTGIAIGVAMALAFAQVFASVVYGVTVRDPWTYAGAIVTMAGVALLAAAIPARRAAAVDPIRALRAE